MINKKNVLGKTPEELGSEDAIHVAIVSVRAASVIRPGERIKLNEHREAIPDEKGFGVADPFMKSNAARGQSLWALLDQDQIPNVQHHWEHPSLDFSPPTREVKLNTFLKKCAEKLGCTYSQLLEACEYVFEKDESAPYHGTLSPEELETALEENVEQYDLWSEWSDESGQEFENVGSQCCPEYNYPEEPLFSVEAR